MWRWLGLAGLVVVLDQAVKAWAESALSLHRPWELLPILDFTLAHNRGAAFSFLQNAGGWQRWFFIGLAVVVGIVIVTWLKRLRAHEWMTAAGLALVLGGAVGNMFDRVLHGYVIDFVGFHYGIHYFPYFNLADSAITIGVGLLLLDSLRGHREVSHD